MAVANHNARIYAGHKMKFLREAKLLQQSLYNQERRKDIMLELEYWLHNHATRHYGLRTITNAFVYPLPPALTAKCACTPTEHQLPQPTILYASRHLLLEPAGMGKFLARNLY